MEKSFYDTLYNMEEKHWWLITRKSLILRFLSDIYKNNTFDGNRQILDMGCGSGYMAEKLCRFGAVTGIDPADEALRYCGKNKFNALKGSLDEVSFESNRFDLITCLDVLEHINDDLKVLRESFRICKNGGFMIVTVPAHQFLWSSHDKVNHHVRRYSKKELEQKIRKAGFEIQKLSYAYCATFPMLLTVRSIKNIFAKKDKATSDLSTVPLFLNKLLVLMLNIEIEILQKINLPWGSSLVCVAKKTSV